MRVLKVLLGSLCLLLFSVASAGAAAPAVVTTGQAVDPPAVDGSNVYYLQHSLDNAGYPIELRRYSLKDGSNTKIRSFNDPAVTVSDLQAGSGRVAFVESRANQTERRIEMKAVAVDQNGAAASALISWTFPLGENGAPVGGLHTDSIRKSGEVIVRKEEMVGPDDPIHLKLIGVRRDGTGHTYLSSTQKVARDFAYSDRYVAWWTLRKLVVFRFDSPGKKVVRPIASGAYRADVDDDGRVLLTTFLETNGGNALRLYAKPDAVRGTLLKSAKVRLPVARFCGERIIVSVQEPAGTANRIVERDDQGKVLSTFFRAPRGANAANARDIVCDAKTIAWRMVPFRSNGAVLPYTIGALAF